jgi:hypothetical protein
MARTKYVPPAGAAKHFHPPRGRIQQQRLRVLWHDTDLESYPLRARESLITKTLPGWKSTWRRDRALKGLRLRLDSDFALKLGFQGVKKREVMAVCDTTRARKLRKLMRISGLERVGDGKPSELVSAGKRSVLVGGEGEKMWVLGEGVRRALGFGIGDVSASSGVGDGRKQGRDEKVAKQLQKETEFWGDYQVLKPYL